MLLMFCDGEKIFEKFRKEYVAHPKGFFVLAPSGAGKTHFVKNQKQKDWIDGDDLWVATGAQPSWTEAWWEKGSEVINEVDQRSDVITKQAKNLGLWIVGASQYWLLPDAIVLPDWRTHKKYISEREKNNYDGGAKSDALEQVLTHRKYMKNLAHKHKIPIFKSIEGADLYLRNLLLK